MRNQPPQQSIRPAAFLAVIAIWLFAVVTGKATPANKTGFAQHYDRFLTKNLNRCTTCHLPSSIEDPESLEDFPHNLFGDRLRVLGEAWVKEGKRDELAGRLAAIATEDSDGDGVANEAELLAGANPGDPKVSPTAEQLADVPKRREEFTQFLASYRWKPFERVRRPEIPKVKSADWVRTPIDAFIAAEHEQRGLHPRTQASKSILLRRVYLDLIGLSPTPEEQRAFEEDHASDAYEKVVDRLLADPRHGERWGRHWMDVWRYSDWAGWTDGRQVRDSQRHIWRWRDWIIESLNQDKGYERMVMEMLAGDELAPEDPATLRATGFLVRNYKKLSREQWLEDTVKHTSQAFLGITVGCAKCHDHMTDPVSQAEYYQVRAIFEPHEVRTDRIPGELDVEKNGLVRVYDVEKETPTYFFPRGDERKPDKDRVMKPAAPKALGGETLKSELGIAAIKLPRDAAFPDKRKFVIKETTHQSEQAVTTAREALAKAKAEASTKPGQLAERELSAATAEAKHAAFLAALDAERLEDAGQKESDEWKQAAKEALSKQRTAALSEARLAVHTTSLARAGAERHHQTAVAAEHNEADAAARMAKKAAADKAAKELEAASKKAGEAEQALAKAEEQAKAEPGVEYKPRPMATYPATSTGRRLAFARWIANLDNPLTARVAMNHLWLRHFGRGLSTTPENLGVSGARPSHPALLDWLAAEFMASGWTMKAMHRLIVTSSAYRMASTFDEANSQIDTDNIYLWRVPSKRMEAELVRDNLLHVAGNLDLTMGGPDIDHAQGLTSKRRSIYLRTAAEKEVEFMKLFDSASVNECYQRRPSVVPQQALALANSELTLAQSQALAKRLTESAGVDDELFVRKAFEQVLARPATTQEMSSCLEFLRGKMAARDNAAQDQLVLASNATPGAPPIPARARENLIRVLFNHNDFVTIR